jgi:metal-responsive CopG/Arc/MetJ family transcriptional regulator
MSMKTAISMPDHVFRDGEALAKRLGVSRSELYSRAVSQFVANYREDEITEQLNQIYSQQESALDPAWLMAQTSVLSEDW